MRVLLIDDEADIRVISKFCLEAVGRCEVVAAANAREGLAAVRRASFDVIVLDMMMPDMDGLATLAALKCDARLAKIPIVFMTAKITREEVEAYLRNGAIGVITKPFDPMTMPGQLAALVSQARLGT